MPNDLNAKQDVLSWSADVRLTLCQHIDSKGFFPRGGGGYSLYLDACKRSARSLVCSDFAQRNKGALGGAT